MKLDDDSKLVAIGVDRKNSLVSESLAVDLSSYGFRGIDLKNFDSRFLLTIGTNGVQEVYSFELGSFPVTRSEATGSPKGPQFRVVPNHPERYPALPVRLLVVADAKKNELLRGALWAALRLGKFSPLAPLAVAIDGVRNQREQERIQVASYLQTLAQMSLDYDSYPELTNSLSRENILELGAALNLRFNPQGQNTGFFIPNSNKIEFYDAIRQVRESDSRKQMSQLIQFANEQGLVVIPMGPNNAMLLYEKGNLVPREHWRQTIIDVRYPEEKVDRTHFEIEKGKLIPLGFFSLNSKYEPLQLVDFQDPNKQAVRKRTLSIIEQAKNISFSFVPASIISVSATLTEGVLKFIFRKKGSTLFEERARNYGETEALLDTGLLRMSADDIKGIAVESLLQDAEDAGVSESLLSSFRNRLKTSEPEILAKTQNEIVETLTRNQAQSSLLAIRSPADVKRVKWIHLERLNLFLRNQKLSEKLAIKIKNNALKAKRQPATSRQKPLLLFLVDGLMPDRLNEAAEKGLVPNMALAFLKRGLSYRSFVSRALTLPSWSTIYTGYEPDSHGIRSNTPANRSNASGVDSFLDFRRELLNPKFILQGASGRYLSSTGRDPFYRSVASGTFLSGISPIHDGLNAPILRMIVKSFQKTPEILAGVFQSSIVLDDVSAQRQVDNIKQSPGKYKVVVTWFGSIDENSHHGNASLNTAMQSIDKNIGNIIEAAKQDPELKDAEMFLISDHGHSGGKEISSKRFLNNTAFNLVTFLSGDFPSGSPFDFVVKADESPHPHNDFGYLEEFMIHPANSTYRGVKNNSGSVSAMVDYSGDKLAQLYFKKSSGWNSRLNYFDLTHYTLKNGTKVNLIETFLNVKLRNLETVDASLRNEIFSESSSHPVDFLAVALEDQVSQVSVREQLPGKIFDRAPVLVINGEGKMALILTQSRSDADSDRFEYLVLKNFNQDSSSKVRLTLSQDHQDDPWGLTAYLEKNHLKLENSTDREWLKKLEGFKMPTAVFSLPRLMTLDASIASNSVRKKEDPDLVLVAHRGYNFNSSHALESDHGGFSREEVKNTFIRARVNGERVVDQRSTEPLLNRDIFRILQESGQFL